MARQIVAVQVLRDLAKIQRMSGIARIETTSQRERAPWPMLQTTPGL
jgi:hypothetical protein